MDVKIDEETVQASLNKAATKAIEEAFHNYSVARVIENEVASTVIGDILEKSITNAIAQIDIDRLSTVLAEELSRTVIKATTFLLRKSCVEIIMDVEKVPSWDDEKRNKKRAELEHRIFNNKL